MLWLSMDFNQNVIDLFAQFKNRRAKFIFKQLKRLYRFFKIANLHIIFDGFCLHHLDSLWIFVTRVYHSRRFILFSVHRMNTSNYKMVLQKIICLN